MFDFLKRWRKPAETQQPRGLRRTASLRRINQSFLKIREIDTDDEGDVRKLLFDHFRSLTIPAMVYWVVQHVHDLVAIIVIMAFLLPIKSLLYFCVCFLVYLYIRARVEIERHIRWCCPDLESVFDTYRTTEGSNFWVGYFSKHEELGTATESNTEAAATPVYTRAEGGGDDNNEEREPALSGRTEPDTDASGTQPAGEGSAARHDSVPLKAPESESQPQLRLKRYNTMSESSVVLKDVLMPNCKENEILGCVGITPYRNKSTVAQMVRLVVSKKCRNMKVGSKLLNHLETFAMDFGYTEIRVYTNNLNTAYLQFLKQNGFVIQQIVRRGFMRGDLIIWNKTLSQPNDLLVTEMPLLRKVDASFIPE
ncbi:acetyltransferase, GNAT family protein, putative [Babesia bigemina]|uniref:Acetyltransferase, GNAT family protein, putative n=1 Tax=Babesia bigemina TaxID=5866 RepID=A0A061DE24_BABBI|nr:acetyltransferase, GNAT family protein, putative [Babesia bigemina]CDR96775.1 acetyltransferase, GNAT family protein, putative [Babesia bigemina]|eukprot:XP_012768961.1 acetyltransferase, GNAT family protein, putative [Babesia bigemina]